jgi:hypothetical protein
LVVLVRGNLEGDPIANVKTAVNFLAALIKAVP